MAIPWPVFKIRSSRCATGFHRAPAQHRTSAVSFTKSLTAACALVCFHLSVKPCISDGFKVPLPSLHEQKAVGTILSYFQSCLKPINIALIKRSRGKMVQNSGGDYSWERTLLLLVIFVKQVKDPVQLGMWTLGS